ncbi:MAG TPA: hypothetical protein VI111_00870 [Thermoleophilaceae bacterium]
MTRTSTTRLKHNFAVAVVLALIVPLALLADRSAAQEPETDTAPIVSNGTVTPSSLPYLGGVVAISADAVDDFGITMVYAEVLGPDGGPQSVQLIQSGPTTYSGSVAIPPNFTDSVASYSVNVQASDTNGATDTQPAGEVSVDAQPQFDEAPIVSDPTVQPRALPTTGGPVTIRANASDNRGVSEVYATITLPDGGSATVPLEPISSSQFEGVYSAPANTGTTAKQYAIEITALDDIGQPGSVDAGFVSVAPRSTQGHCRQGPSGAPSSSSRRSNKRRSASSWASARARR